MSARNKTIVCSLLLLTLGVFIIAILYSDQFFKRHEVIKNNAILVDDPSLPPVYDIPKILTVKIDGVVSDWGKNGLMVDRLAIASGRVQPISDFDASFRLAWNDAGLIAYIKVHDDIPIEEPGIAAGDSIELFIATKVGSKDFLRILISPGMDPSSSSLRTRVIDLRKDLVIRNIQPQVTAARTTISDGYGIEVLVPWSQLGILPKVGTEIGVQLQINDVDAIGRAPTRHVWYPSLTTAKDSSKMHRVRLNVGASPTIQVAAFGDYPHFHKTHITVVADAKYAGKTVELAPPRSSIDESDDSELDETDPNSTAAPASRSLVHGILENDFVRTDLSSTSLSMHMPPRGTGYGRLDVLIDSQRVGVIDLPPPENIAKWVLPYEEYIFKPCVFSTREFPDGDFADPSYVEDLIGSYDSRVTYYDKDYNVVTTAENPGRYGAIVEIRAEDNQIFRRYRTLFREPKDFSWRNTEMPFTVKLPKEMGISPDAVKAQQESVSNYFKELLHEEGLTRDGETSVLLAGLYETRKTDESLLRNTPASRDRAWWAGLKQRLHLPVMDHLTYLPADYRLNDKKLFPLVLFLHGKGERGGVIEQIKDSALPSRLEYEREFRNKFPAITIAPQCPAGEVWSTHQLIALLDEVQSKYRVDPDRVYVTGMSMGGYGTWALASEFPERFAAIAPVCGGGDLGEIKHLTHIPVWAFHGRKDNVVPFAESQRLVQALQPLNPQVKFTAYPDTGHDAWTETYNNPKLYEWLFSHIRSNSLHSNGNLPTVASSPTSQPTEALKLQNR